MKAQTPCVTIANLPDTIIACKNTQVSLSPTVTSTGLLNTTDTTWTPASDLSNPNIINPIVTVGTTSTSYKLTVSALTPFNFVGNGDFSGGNTGFSTSYIYGTGGSWGLLSLEGQYAIATNPNNTHVNFASFGDHTTGTGQMMVVNGAGTANVSIWCQTITVQPNTTYDFSAWGATCVASDPAILQFSINNTLLGTPFNLTALTGVWEEFHTTWFSGSNTSATICITNQNTATSGNDFALDDITFREICNTSDSVYIHVMNLQPGINAETHLGCGEDTVRFSAVNNADTADAYKWDFGDGTGSTLKDPEHIYTTQGVYNIKLVTEKNGCKDSAMTSINTLHPLSVDFTISDDSICLGEQVQFTSTASGASSLTYYWDFGDSTTSSQSAPIHDYTTPGIYTVMHVINDTIPCYDTIYKTVLVIGAPTGFMEINDSLLCEGQSVHFTGNYVDGYKQATWNFGDGNYMFNTKDVSHAYDSTGLYNVSLTVTYDECPEINFTKTVEVFPFPQIDLGPDTSMCPFAAPLLISNKKYNPANSYLWATGEVTPTIMARHPGIYYVTATTPAGCAASDSIEVFKSCYLDIPNAFTPDGDNVNDYFLPRQLLSKKLSLFHMQVFNRWGQLIFETNSLNGRGWDGRFNGKEQPTGVYVYLIQASFDTDYIEEYKGNVTLLR